LLPPVLRFFDTPAAGPPPIVALFLGCRTPLFLISGWAGPRSGKGQDEVRRAAEAGAGPPAGVSAVPASSHRRRILSRLCDLRRHLQARRHPLQP